MILTLGFSNPYNQSPNPKYEISQIDPFLPILSASTFVRAFLTSQQCPADSSTSYYLQTILMPLAEDMAKIASLLFYPWLTEQRLQDNDL